MEFSNQVVLVTGSTRGIGRGIAEAFARKGAAVIINGRSTEQVERVVREFAAEGYRAEGAAFDTADRQAAMEGIQEAAFRLGDIAVLVNNAGISPKKNGRKVLIKDMEYQEWTRVVDVNLNGVFTCCQAVIPAMIKRREGRIVNIASAFARYYTPAATSHYITTKTAVIGLTRALAGELAQYGITCNAVAPGRAWTEMTRSQPSEVNEAFIKTIPLGRFAEIEDIAGAVLFLAGKEGGYFTGATLDVNGGICMV